VLTRRVWLNLGAFLAAAALLVYMGMTQLVLQPGGGKELKLEFRDAAGILARNDVTMRGVPVGAVTAVTLTPRGIAEVTVELQPGVKVPQGTQASITRRSPIGDLTVELMPGKGEPLPNDATIGLSSTHSPPDPERTIEELARVLHSVPSGDLQTLVRELATAVRGRGGDLARLSEVSADLPEKLLQVRSQLTHLIETGPKVLDVLADNAGTLADDLTQTAELADILRDNRYKLLDLSTNGARFLKVANELLAWEKPNLACFIAEMGDVNASLAEPQHLQDLVNTLDLNHYFFDAVWQSVQTSKIDGFGWFRVQLLPHQEPAGRAYGNRRDAPDVFMGNACHSIYGPGVGPASQPGPVWLANGSTLHTGH
jgi:phospholipid/cholesterol/gamma-HCH transport system substrate-binding protein